MSRRRIFKTQGELAAACGVGQSTVRTWVRRDDWPASKTGPWSELDIEPLRKWRATLQEDRSAESRGAASADDSALAGLSIEKRAKLDLIIARKVSVEIKNQTATGKLIDADEVERGRVARIHAVKARLNALPAEAAKAVTELDSIDYVSVEALLQGMVDAICEDFARK